MRTYIVLALVLVASVCRAEDALESLNTVEDTVVTMHRTLKYKSTAAEEPRSATDPSKIPKLPDLEEKVISDELLGPDGVPSAPPPRRQTRSTVQEVAQRESLPVTHAS